VLTSMEMLRIVDSIAIFLGHYPRRTIETFMAPVLKPDLHRLQVMQ
jgi:hypothetical protein